MEKLHIALLLLDLNKTETKLFVLLHLLKNTEHKENAYKIEQICELLGFSRSTIINAFATLENKNIVGKLVFESGLVEKKIAKGFNEDFLKTVFNPKQAVEFAIKRAGYRIVDDDFVFVLNPVIKSWKYPAKTKVLKAINSFKKVFKDDEFISYLKSSLKKGRQSANTSINGWNIHESIQLFVKKYKDCYNANYIIDKKLEYRLMKNVLTTLNANNVDTDKLEKFFDYAFNKGKNKKSPVHISTLKYYANEFVTNVVKKDVATSDYYYDEKGRLHRKNNSIGNK